MGEKIRGHIRSNVIGYVALFIALSGAAYAGPLKPNKVKTKHIKDAAVTTPKLADGAVTTPKLANDSVTGAKVAPDSLGGGDIDESSLQGLSASPTGAAGGDLTGSFPNPDIAAGAVGSAEIADATRSFNLPLGSFVDPDAQSAIDFDSANAATAPDFEVVNGSVVIEYDDAAGNDDDNNIESTLYVPQDFASGGSFALRVSKDAHGGTNEQVGCRIALNGGAPTGYIATGTTTAANTTYTVGPFTAPGFSLSPGDSVAVQCRVIAISGSADDIVRFHSIEFRYTATQ
jgi:hypothetical protein